MPLPRLLAGITSACLLVVAATAAGAAPEDVRLVSEPLVEGLIAPSAVTQTPSGSFLIAEKRGAIFEWSPGDPEARRILDISEAGLNLAQSDGDRAVLGLVADPGYDDEASPGHRRFYLSYNSRFGPPGSDMIQPGGQCPTFDDCPASGVVAAAVVPPTGQAQSVEVIHDAWCANNTIHPAGDLVWSGDGERLYASMGDGIDSRGEQPGYWDFPGDPCNDPPGFGGPWKAQHAVALDEPSGQEGSVLSFSLDEVRSPETGTDPVLVATGQRNPWRMAVDPDLGDLYIGNVGWFEYEEVDRVPAADIAAGDVHNSGWPCAEGDDPSFRLPSYHDHPYCVGLRAAGGVDAPWLFYGDDSGPASFQACPVGRSVGPVIPIRPGADDELPLGLGSGLLVADFVRGCAWLAGRPASGQPYSAVEPQHIPAKLPFFVDGVHGADGDLYWLAIATDGGAGLGRLNRLRLGAVAHIRMTPAPAAGENAILSGAESLTSAEPSALQYAWDLDGDGQFDDATGALAEVAVPSATPVPVALRVTDALGRTHITRSRAVVGTAPSVTLLSTPAADVVRGNTRITVEAAVYDPDGDTSAGRTTWSVEIEHCPNVCHTHPILSATGRSITFTAAPHDTFENSFYRVVARNRDAAGLETVVSREVRVSDSALPPEQPGPDPSEQEPPLLPPSTPPATGQEPNVLDRAPQTTPPTTPGKPAKPGRRPPVRQPRLAPVTVLAPPRTIPVRGSELKRVIHRIRINGQGRYRLVLQDARTGRTIPQLRGSAVGKRRARAAARLQSVVLRPKDLGRRGARALVVTSVVRAHTGPVRLVVRRAGGPRPRGAVVHEMRVRTLR